MADETEIQEDALAQEEGQPRPEKSESSATTGFTSEQQEKIDKLIDISTRERHRGLNKQIDSLTRERDGLKAQLDKAVSEATALKEATEGRIAELEVDLEESVKGDADAAEVQKLKRELRAEKAKLAQESKAERDAIAAEKEALTKEREEWAETVANAQEATFELAIFDISEEYENGDANLLKTLCDKAGIKTKEGAEELASVMWKKGTKSEEDKETMTADSGVSSGGGEMTYEKRLKSRYPNTNF